MGCGGRSKQRPYETGAAKNYDGPDFARDICQGDLTLRTATEVKRAGPSQRTLGESLWDEFLWNSRDGPGDTKGETGAGKGGDASGEFQMCFE
jgi:hypothetical protein